MSSSLDDLLKTLAGWSEDKQVQAAGKIHDLLTAQSDMVEIPRTRVELMTVHAFMRKMEQRRIPIAEVASACADLPPSDSRPQLEALPRSEHAP